MNDDYKKNQADSWRKFAHDSITVKKKNAADKKAENKTYNNLFDKLKSKDVKKDSTKAFKPSEVISPMFGKTNKKTITNDFVSSKLNRSTDDKHNYRTVDEYISKKVKSEALEDKYPEWRNRNQNNNDSLHTKSSKSSEVKSKNREEALKKEKLFD